MNTPLLGWIYTAKITASGAKACGIEGLRSNQVVTKMPRTEML